MDYLETRPYTEGDDIRSIDWRVTARSGKMHSKVFIEERDRPILLLGDFSSSMYFGTRKAFKSVVAARIGAALAFSGIKRGDRVGCIIQGVNESFDLRPKGGRSHTMRVLKALSDATKLPNLENSLSSARSLDHLLAQANRGVPTGSTVILLSDFYQDTALFHKSLFSLAQRADIIGFHLFDPLEQQLPLARNVPLSDGNKRIQVYTQKKDQLAQKQRFEHWCKQLKTLFEKLGQVLVHVSTEQDLSTVLAGKQQLSVVKKPSPKRNG